MIKNICLGILCFISVQLSAQGEFYPPKVEISDYTLSRFLTELTLAVGKKDKDFILEHLDPHILNSFGGNGGIEEFTMYWDFKSDSTKFWEVMENILLIGGPSFDASKDNNSYYLPFTFTDWPEQYDAFEHYLVLGNNVNVRSKPTTENSEVLGQLSYQIVKISDSEGEILSENNHWLNITTVDNGLSGFVYGKFLISPIGYRLGLIKTENGWKINMLVAGD
ncbi:MAG: SH3 domain-containing protein [Bacteroidota bacterium]|nr:SH3 domain-containing protein [Bacteroidota bacterium]